MISNRHIYIAQVGEPYSLTTGGGLDRSVAKTKASMCLLPFANGI